MPKIEVKIWNYFEKLTNRNKIASCNYCHRALSYKTTVTNLKTHLKTKHVEEYKAFLSESEAEFENAIYLAELDDDEDIEQLYIDDSEISSNTKTVKRDALIWKHFQESGIGYKTAICNYCFRQLSFKSSPSYLRSHLRLKHKAVFKEFLSMCRMAPGNESNSISPSDDQETQADSEGSVSEHTKSHSAEESKHDIWNIFEICSNGKTALCKHCFKNVIFDNRVTNLKLHLQIEHGDEYKKLMNEKKTYATESDTGGAGSSLANDQDLLVEYVPEKKRRKRCVPIWNYFEESNDGNRTAICNYCGKKLSYRTTITNLKTHLQQKHFVEYNEFLNLSGIENKGDSVVDNEGNLGDGNKSAKNSECGDAKSSFSKNGSTDETSRKSDKILQTDVFKELQTLDTKKIDLSLLKFIIHDLQHFSIVNNVGFCEFIQALNPNYVIPDQKSLINSLLPEIYEKRLQELKEFVSINAKSVCITIDCWITCSGNNYIGITAHFLTQDPVQLQSIFIECSEFDIRNNRSRGIYKKIKDILNKWDVYDKVNFMVTNNVPHLEKAAIHFENEGWSHFMCFAHKLNAVVEVALGEIKDTISKVQIIVKHVTKNPKAEQDLFKYLALEQVKTDPKTVIESVPNRWNTVYLMLERFVELKQSLEAIILNSHVTLPMLNADEWKVIEQICIILKPFYEVTVEMSLDKYLIASKAYILTSNLIHICNSSSESQDLHTVVRAIATKLKYDLKNRLGNIESNEKFGLCTILDPRFKLKGIKNKKKVEQFKNNIKKLMIEMKDDKHKKMKTEHTKSCYSKANSTQVNKDLASYSLWCEFDEEVKKINDAMPDELDRYLDETLIKRTENPLKYWQEHECVYPTLFKLFIKHCNIILTSVPCEQFYTESGYMTNQRKTLLPSTNIAEIMFLNANKM